MSDYLVHHGIKGQKWGIRRYQNEDGTLTEAGRKRYGYDDPEIQSKLALKNKTEKEFNDYLSNTKHWDEATNDKLEKRMLDADDDLINTWRQKNKKFAKLSGEDQRRVMMNDFSDKGKNEIDAILGTNNKPKKKMYLGDLTSAAASAAGAALCAKIINSAMGSNVISVGGSALITGAANYAYNRHQTKKLRRRVGM